MIIAIDALFHALTQDSLVILSQQAVPPAAPDHFDYVPVGTAKAALQLLNDLPIAPHRAIQALQITVNHQYQVVQFFPGGDTNSAENFWFIRLAVANVAPDSATVFLLETTVLQVLGKASLVDCGRGGETHGGIGHLPELRH